MPSDERIYAYTPRPATTPYKGLLPKHEWRGRFYEASRSQGLQEAVEEDAKAEWSIPDLYTRFEGGCVGLTCATADLRPLRRSSRGCWPSRLVVGYSFLGGSNITLETCGMLLYRSS
jgi:hypothetical protein